MNYTDTHCHLYSDDFQEDIESVVSNSILSGVNKILLPNIDTDSIDVMHELSARFPENCFPMMGLHPCSVGEDYTTILEKMYSLFSINKYVGVGEVGMDLYWDKTTEKIQKDALIKQVEWAIEFGLPLSLHTRNATQKVLEILKPYKGKVTGVFHCFSESQELADEIIKLGFYLGIGGVVTFKKAGIINVLNDIGIDKVVLETDSPYLAPTPYRGKRNEPSYVKNIAEFISDSLDIELHEVSKSSQRNVNQLFGNL